MIVEYEGGRYDFEFEDITVKQAMKIEKHTGSSLTQWGDRLEQGNDFIALQALGWLILFEGKGAVDDADFKVTRFGNAFIKAMTELAEQRKAAEASAPVPTVAVPASNGHLPDARRHPRSQYRRDPRQIPVPSRQPV